MADAQVPQSNERLELEELRRLDELEQRAAQASQETQAAPTQPAPMEPTPQPSTIPAQPDQPSLLNPRLTLDDLTGPIGQGALVGGLTMAAITPGPFKIPAFIAGAGGSLLADEGTRRLQESIGEIPGYLAGLGLSILSGGGIGKYSGRTPSHPTKFKDAIVESPETTAPLDPTIKGLYNTVPEGGAYSTRELLTEPGSRISPEHQFSTGSGESLFGPLQRVDAPESPMMGGQPIEPTIPGRAWQQEGIPSPTIQEKYPTIEQKPVGPAQLGLEERMAPKPKGVVPQPKPVTPKSTLDTGSIGPSGEYVPPKNYVEPPLPSRWRQAWDAEKQRWGQELPVLREQPESPVISSVEGTHVYVEDFIENYVHQPWIKSLMKFGDNTKLAPLEKQWIADYKAGRDPQATMPDDFKKMHQRMDALLAEDNALFRRRGLPEISKNDGPYAPRITDEDFKLQRSITRQQEGAKTSQTIGPFQQPRTVETLAEGLAKGITYKDWRMALLLREARSAVLRSTDIMMTDLEKAGVIHRTKEGAEAVSLTGKAYPAEGLPFPPEGGQWWIRSLEERQFLLQNLRQMGSGTLADIRGWAQQWLRNPSLVNPWPHIMKNMGLKQMQQAVASGLNPANVIKQTFIHRWGKPDMMREFQQVMPFTESGRTVWEIIEKVGPKTAIQRLSRVPGILNAYARRKIFAEWDPAMRYGLWREYVRKGMTPQEAANHTWIDLIRYLTRAERIDAWNSIPFNFFVPWRVGTLRTMNKALQSAPVRFSLFMGAVDTIREMDYRINGRWTHLPYDYIERPLMTLIKEGKSEALQTLAATIIAGPGGEYMFRTIQNLINELQGKGAIGDLRTIGWGMAQVYDLWPQYEAWEKDHNPAHLTDMLGLILLGRHATPYGAPHRLGELIPESLIRTHPQVKAAEALREAIQEKGEVKGTVKQMRDIQKYQEPFQPQIK